MEQIDNIIQAMKDHPLWFEWNVPHKKLTLYKFDGIHNGYMIRFKPLKTGVSKVFTVNQLLTKMGKGATPQPRTFFPAVVRK